MTEEQSQPTTEEAKHFKDMANKLFQVPIEEVRELEAKQQNEKNDSSNANN